MNDQASPVTQLVPQNSALMPKTLDEAIKFSQLLAKSDMVPKDFIDKPANVLVAVQWGMELGLQPLQAMQNIAVINGRPSLWGDAVIALVRSSPLCEYVKETVTDTLATCAVKRRGEVEAVRTFGQDDAKRAGLWGKQGPWTNYPKRMMQMRARAWALRDVFPDVLRGMPIAEEVLDTPVERDVTPTAPVEMPRATTTAKPPVRDAEVVEGAAGDPPADPAGLPTEVADPSEVTPENALKEGQIRVIRAKMAQTALSEIDFKARWGSPLTDGDGFPNFRADQANDLIAWASTPKG